MPEPIKVCPNCGSEFVARMEECIDCGTPLVVWYEELGELGRRPAPDPPPPASTADTSGVPHGDLVPLRKADLGLLHELAERLAQRGIPTQLGSEEGCSGSCTPVLLVRSQDAQAAFAVDQEFIRTLVPEGEALPVDLSADRCPACGTGLGGSEAECPDCGLVLGQVEAGS